MSQLVPCPNCQRHVRQSESTCPFCQMALSLDHIPLPELPRSRLGRAATFAFGATLVGATTLLACGGESETKEGGGGAGGKAGASSGGTSAGQAQGGTGIGPVYGAPAAGTSNDSGGGVAVYGAPPSGGAGGTGTAGPVYGAPPSAGTGNDAGGTPGIPIYGAAPAD